jgi:hypothetical protein
MKIENKKIKQNDLINQKIGFKFLILKNNRKKGMVFKPSFKCFKDEKINFTQAFLKQETLLYQNMFLLFYHILYL